MYAAKAPLSNNPNKLYPTNTSSPVATALVDALLLPVSLAPVCVSDGLVPVTSSTLPGLSSTTCSGLTVKSDFAAPASHCTSIV